MGFQIFRQRPGQKTMRGILPFIDVVVGNEEDCHDVLGIQAGDTDVHSGALDTSRYPDVARQVIQQFPNLSKVINFLNKI